ncbi:MAG: hypothetical protein ACRERU_01360 [Methylococcales bacterium]
MTTNSLSRLGEAVALTVTAGLSHYPDSTKLLIAESVAAGSVIRVTIDMPPFRVKAELIDERGKALTLFEVLEDLSEATMN